MIKKLLISFVLLLILIFVFKFTASAISGIFYEASNFKEYQYISKPAVIQGGEITDGKDLRNIRWGKHPYFERIVLDIYEGAYGEKGPPASVPCRFNIKYEYYPFHFTITLMGIRSRTAEFSTFKNSKMIKDIYQLPMLDDSGIKFAVSLKQPVKFEVFELYDPARIVLDISNNLDSEKLLNNLPEIYSLRTGIKGDFETLDLIKERLYNLYSENVRILQAAEGSLFVEEGYYHCLQDAEDRLNILSNKMEDINFYIEKRGPLTIPEADLKFKTH